MDKGFARKLLHSDPVRPNDTDIYRKQTEAFRRKFGREMGPDDPFFFDPEADTPQFRSPKDADIAIDLLARLMGEAGVDPAAIYAFKKTRGLFPSPALPLSAQERVEWNAAVYEYNERLRTGRNQ
jgi:hypothetical protein